jgi:acyl carrier protein
MLSYEEFTATVVAVLELAGDPKIGPSDRLAEDIEFDSLDFFVFFTVIEELSGVTPGSVDDRPVATMQEAFDLYRELCDEAP